MVVEGREEVGRGRGGWEVEGELGVGGRGGEEDNLPTY